MKLQKQLLSQIKAIVSNAQQQAVRSVNTERVTMYWQIGKVIFEEEQQGKDRAEYAAFLIQSISQELQPVFGSGFSVRQLEMNRQFYRIFPNTNALRSQFSWTHYRTLLRIDNQDKRAFYIAETEKNNWSARQLQMYVNYYDRTEKKDFENPTIGILLCADKNDAMVKITLPENNKTIIASKYQLYLPTEKQLIDEVMKEVKKRKKKL